MGVREGPPNLSIYVFIFYRTINVGVSLLQGSAQYLAPGLMVRLFVSRLH